MRSTRDKLIAWMARVSADRPVFGVALAIVVASVLLCANVYYDYRKTLEGEYLALERQSLLAGARIEVNDEKKNPGDFALWKAAKPGEPFWESP